MALPCLSTGRPTRRLFPLLAVCLLTSRAAIAGPLTGRVLDPEGRPVAGARVLAAGPIGVRSTLSDGDGRFTLSDLPDATYRVTADAPGLSAAQTVRAVGPVADVDLRLALTAYNEAVLVSAAPVPLAQSEAPATATVVDADQIARHQWRMAADVLRHVPGFSVGQNGGFGALTSIFPRGGESDYTLVLVDGVRLNSFGGGFNASLLPLGDVEQVEIVRGPQSAVFGADAIGGVVHVTTRHGGEPSVHASLEGGGQQTVRGLAAARGTLADRWSFGASGERNQSDGYTGVAPATAELVSNDDWRQSVGQAHVEWTHSASTSVRADVRYLDSERGSPGPYGSNPIGAYEQVDRIARGEDTNRNLALSGRLPWSPALSGRVQQRWQLTVADFDNRYHSTFGDSLFETRRVTARTQTDVILSPTTGVTAGVEGFGERARSTYITGSSFQEVPIERRTLGGFAELRQDLGARASVTAGLRVDDIRRAALEGDPSAFSPRPAFPALSVTSVNPRIAARAVLWQDAGQRARTTVRASAGTGIRPPDAFEIAFTDNPSLEPERSRSVDVGISHVVFGAGDAGRAGSLTVGVTAFHNRYDDLIIAVGSSFRDRSRYRTDNISNARARGVEVDGAWRGPAGLTARLAYTRLDTEILEVDDSETAPPPFTVGDPLLRRPRHAGSLDLAWAHGRLAAFSTFRARSSVLDVEPSFGTFGGLFTAPGFAVLDGGASVRVARQVTVFGRGLNLLDREYEEAFGYPSPGRLGMIGVRVDLRR